MPSRWEDAVRATGRLDVQLVDVLPTGGESSPLTMADVRVLRRELRRWTGLRVHIELTTRTVDFDTWTIREVPGVCTCRVLGHPIASTPNARCS